MGPEEKYISLKDILHSLGRVVVAFSGGVDSTFLLKAAVDTLSADNVLACIGISSSLAKSQYDQGIAMAKQIGANVRDVHVEELDDPQYRDNRADRCFHCKMHLYRIISDIANEEKFPYVLCGSNFDDLDDFRPGNRAARVFNVRSPLMEAEMTKEDIRIISRKLGLATADVPASPCLASRIAYGLEVTEARLQQVEQAEDFLRSIGFIEFRVRHHGDIARIEIPPEQIEKITSKSSRKEITERFKIIGFKFVTVDLQGFRSGALNESLTEEEKQKNT